MANRRMFSLDVVDTDKFLDMPATSQNLYFHLGMRADDEGFVSSPKKITKLVNCGSDDLNVLVSRGYVLPVGDGVVVITHWHRNNYIQSDRRKASIYQDEVKRLLLHNGVYALDTECIQDVSKLETQDRSVENNIVKSIIYCSSFEEFWTLYPRKKEKAKASRAYQARLRDGFSEAELLSAAKQYAEECKKDRREEKYIKLGATFLGPATPFVDYLQKEEVIHDESESNSSTRLW